MFQGVRPVPTPSQQGGDAIAQGLEVEMEKHGLLLAAFLSLAMGCIGPDHRPPEAWVTGPPEPVVDRDYTIGQPGTARAGAVMVRLKRSWVRKRIQASITLDRQVAVTTRDRTIILPHGRVLANLGTIDLDGVQYIRYADAGDDDGSSPIYYIRPDGTMAGFVYGRGGLGVPRGIQKIKHVPFRFPVRCTTEPDPGREQNLCTLLFRSMDEKVIRLDYEEFSAHDPEHPVRTEALSIPRGQRDFTFEGLRLRLDPGSGDSLRYTVVSDTTDS